MAIGLRSPSNVAPISQIGAAHNSSLGGVSLRLVSFEGGFGRLEGQGIVPMGADLVAYLAGAPVRESSRVAGSTLHQVPAVPHPAKIICVGLNYRDHASESNQPIPEHPVLLAKFANSLIGPGDHIRLPALAPERVDYEAELGVVIGRTASRVPEQSALEFVAGYICANDVSARDLQFQSSQWLRGKAIDSFLPIGPCLVTADEIPDPQALRIQCLVNGDLLQDSNTRDMVFGVAELVSAVSQTVTLVPGDIICTGTPGGVGAVRKPPRFLSEGDEVTVRIERIGDLTNPVASS